MLGKTSATSMAPSLIGITDARAARLGFLSYFLESTVQAPYREHIKTNYSLHTEIIKENRKYI